MVKQLAFLFLFFISTVAQSSQFKLISDSSKKFSALLVDLSLLKKAPDDLFISKIEKIQTDLEKIKRFNISSTVKLHKIHNNKFGSAFTSKTNFIHDTDNFVLNEDYVFGKNGAAYALLVVSKAKDEPQTLSLRKKLKVQILKQEHSSFNYLKILFEATLSEAQGVSEIGVPIETVYSLPPARTKYAPSCSEIGISRAADIRKI